MVAFITGSWFLYFYLPVGTALLGIFIRWEMKKEGNGLKKADFAVGPDLILAAIIAYLVLMTERAIELSNQPILGPEVVNAMLDSELGIVTDVVTLGGGYVVAVMMILLWTVSSVVRRYGWEKDDINWWGLGLPIIPGLLTLSWVASLAGHI